MDASVLEQTVRIHDGPSAGQQSIYRLSVHDTAGQERYRSLNKIYYRGALGALVVYDITDLDSFERMKAWVKELWSQRGRDLPIVIVGNKSDLEGQRLIQQDQA